MYVCNEGRGRYNSELRIQTIFHVYQLSTKSRVKYRLDVARSDTAVDVPAEQDDLDSPYYWSEKTQLFILTAKMQLLKLGHQKSETEYTMKASSDDPRQLLTPRDHSRKGFE